MTKITMLGNAALGEDVRMIAQNSHTSLCILLAMLCAGMPLAAGPSETQRHDLWITDGQVHAMAEYGPHTYIGGYFSYVGPQTGSAAVADLATDKVLPGFPEIFGLVECAIPDGSGGWFIGGDFTRVDGAERRNLIHVTANNTLDTAFMPDPDGPVYSLLLDGADLYAGGNFWTVAGNNAAGLAKVNADPTHAGYGGLSPWNAPSPQGVVFALCLNAGTLYAGGEFDYVDGVPHANLAAIDAATGSVDHAFIPWTKKGPGLGRIVAKLSVYDNRLFVGGNFELPGGGVVQNDLAALTLPGGDLDTTFAPVVGSPTAFGAWVTGMLIDNGTIYFAGTFTEVNGSARKFAAAIDANGALLPFNPGSASPSRAMGIAKSGNSIYLGGDPRTAGNEQCNSLAAVDAASGQALPFGLRCNVNARCLAVQGGRLFAGGYFTSIGGVERRHLARIVTLTGEVDHSWVFNADNSVDALALLDDRLFASGAFANIGGVSRGGFAAIDLLADLIGAAPNSVISGGSGGTKIRCMSVIGDTLYCGGNFSDVDGQTRGCLAAFDAAGNLLPSWAPSADDDPTASGPPVWPNVKALAAIGTRLIVAGEFVAGISWPGGSIPCAHLGAIECDPASPGYGTAVNWTPRPDTAVWAAAVTAGQVFICGDFGAVDGIQRSGFAAFDWPSGALDSNWNPALVHFGSITSPSFYSLAALGDVLFVSGFGNLATIGINSTRPDYGYGASYTLDLTGIAKAFIIANRFYISGQLNDGTWINPRQHFAGYYISPVIRTGVLPGATENTAYGVTLAAADAVQALWSISPANALPDGLTLDPATGIISGTPQAGSGNRAYTFTVSVMDTSSSNPTPYDGRSRDFTLFVAGGAVALPFTTGFEAGELCPGALSLGDTSRAQLTGQAARPGAGSRGLQLDARPDAMQWALQSLSGAGQAGADDPARWASDASNHVSALGWTVDGTSVTELSVEFDWSVVNTLNTWYANLVFEVYDGSRWRAAWGSDATVTSAGVGIYRDNSSSGFRRTTIQVTGLTPAANLQLRLRALIKSSLDDLPFPTAVFVDNLSVTGNAPSTIPAQLVIAPLSPPAGQEGVAYAPVPLAASGGAQPYTWSIIGGQLPDGLTLTGGAIAGTPQVGSAGDYTLTIEVRDAAAIQQAASAVLTLSIAGAAQPPVAPPAASAGGALSSAGACALHTNNSTQLWNVLLLAFAVITSLTTHHRRARPDRDAS